VAASASIGHPPMTLRRARLPLRNCYRGRAPKRRCMRRTVRRPLARRAPHRPRI
jgi:hypothetical protein